MSSTSQTRCRQIIVLDLHGKMCRIQESRHDLHKQEVRHNLIGQQMAEVEELAKRPSARLRKARHGGRGFRFTQSLQSRGM